MSGVDLDGVRLRKGAGDAIAASSRATAATRRPS